MDINRQQRNLTNNRAFLPIIYIILAHVFASCTTIRTELDIPIENRFVVSPALLAFVPANSVAYDSIPQIYNQWWREIKNCAKIRGNKFKIIKWFSTPPEMGYNSFNCLIAYCFGYHRYIHEIYIVTGRELDEKLIKHEMLHELLGVKGYIGKNLEHPQIFTDCNVL